MLALSSGTAEAGLCSSLPLRLIGSVWNGLPALAASGVAGVLFMLLLVGDEVPAKLEAFVCDLPEQLCIFKGFCSLLLLLFFIQCLGSLSQSDPPVVLEVFFCIILLLQKISGISPASCRDQLVG